jgi:hypothetical protein
LVVDKEDASRLKDLVVRGTEMGTAVAGATVAARYLAEDANAVVNLLVDEAPLFAGTIAWLATDYLDRRLSRRERLRVDAAITFAAHKAYENIMNGREVRSDEFFQPEEQGGRPPSEEIAEAVMLAVQREPEERKVRHIGFILGNLAFAPFIDRVAGNLFVRVAEDLSYTQMQLVALVGRRAEIALPPGSEEAVGGVSWKAASVSRQFAELGFGYKELIQSEPEKEKFLPTNIGIPDAQQLTAFGHNLFVLMDLASVPIEEVRDVAASLWEASGKGEPTDPECTACSQQASSAVALSPRQLAAAYGR